VGHLIVVYFFVCLAAGLTALGTIALRRQRMWGPLSRYLFFFFLSFTLLVLHALVYAYVQENVRPPSMALSAGLLSVSCAIGGLFLCSLLLFANALKLRKNGIVEWALAIAAPAAYCVLVLLATVPDPESPALYTVRLPWYIVATVLYCAILASTFIPLKPTREADQPTRLAYRRITVVSVIFLPFIALDILFNFNAVFQTVFPIRFFPLLYCAYAALIVRERLRRTDGEARNTVVLPGDWFYEKYRISPREREIVELVLRGMNNPAIARTLFISVPTVKTHVQRIFQKVGVANRFELMRFLSAAPTDRSL
jgi:DNA-binding CsgD family transcriptional regulator